MSTLLVTVILAVGLHFSTVRSLDPRLVTDNADVQNTIVEKHNECRRGVNPPACDMQKMTWSAEIAANAKRYAAKCIYKHSLKEERTISTSACGENLAQASGMFLSWVGCIDLWYDERNNFDYGKGPKSSTLQYLHYTQVVWSKSVQVGCAYQECPGFGLYVCQYGPLGNIGTIITHPYEAGTPCGKCPNNCENKLCTNPCYYANYNTDCPQYKSFCSQTQIASACEGVCKCG